MRYRYHLTVEYDGRSFVGWQRQAEGVSVQGVLEDAVGALTVQESGIVAAGRTDAGVHAFGQSVHVDLDREWPEDRLIRAFNAHIDWAVPVAVLSARLVRADFHARFDALGRRYLYRISDRIARPALESGRVWRPRCSSPLDVGEMARAARALVGHHDFTAFRDSACQASSAIRTLDEVCISRRGDVIEMVFVARSFLHRQVRSMVGSLVEVGRGRWDVERIARVLAAGDRGQCGPVAPAEGLYLVSVDYADEDA